MKRGRYGYRRRRSGPRWGLILPLLLALGGVGWLVASGSGLPGPLAGALAGLPFRAPGAASEVALAPGQERPAARTGGTPGTPATPGTPGATAPAATPTPEAAARLLEADRLLAEGRWAAAATAYADVVRAMPTSAVAQARWARALVYANRPAEGVERAQKAVDVDPRLAEAQATLALAHGWNGNPDRAITAARRAIELDPKLPEAQAFLAEAFTDRYRLREAEEALDRAVGLPGGKDDPEVLRVQGYLQETKADYPAAVASYRRAVERAPQRSYLWLSLGHALRTQKLYDEALRAFQQANDLNPQDARAEGGMGMVYYALEEYGSAQGHLERAVEIDPGYATGYGQLGWVAYVQKAYDRAQPYFEKAVELEKDPTRNAAYRHALGWAYVNTKRYDRAKQEFTKALELSPGLEGAREGLQTVERLLAAPEASKPAEAPKPAATPKPAAKP